MQLVLVNRLPVTLLCYWKQLYLIIFEIWVSNILLIERSNFLIVFTDATSHKPSWHNIVSRLGGSLPTIDGKELINRNGLLTLHIYTIYKLKALTNVADKITLLQNLHRILENYKTM